jgi:hypothetical protein
MISSLLDYFGLFFKNRGIPGSLFLDFKCLFTNFLTHTMLLFNSGLMLNPNILKFVQLNLPLQFLYRIIDNINKSLRILNPHNTLISTESSNDISQHLLIS